MAKPIDLPFGLLTQLGRRKHKFNCIRQVVSMCPHGRAHLSPPGKNHWTIRLQWWCCLMSNYSDHSLWPPCSRCKHYIFVLFHLSEVIFSPKKMAGFLNSQMTTVNNWISGKKHVHWHTLPVFFATINCIIHYNVLAFSTCATSEPPLVKVE